MSVHLIVNCLNNLWLVQVVILYRVWYSCPQIDSGVRKLMNKTAEVWQQSPTLLTYVGGSRNRRNGMFAGITDIQGMDM